MIIFNIFLLTFAFSFTNKRCWFAKRGVNFKLIRKRKKRRLAVVEKSERKIPWDVLHTRVAWEIQQRRFNARAALFSKFYENYVNLVSILKTNVDHWINLDQAVAPDIDRLWKDKTKFELVYTKQSAVLSI